MEKKRNPNQSTDWMEYATPLIFILAMGGTGWYQYKKLTEKKLSAADKKAEEDLQKARQKDPPNRTSSLNRDYMND